VASERVVENSSQDVSPFVVVEGRIEVTKVESTFMISETMIDGTGDELPVDRKSNWEESSSGVVTEEDGEGGAAIS
jgi:hypothetical protein